MATEQTSLKILLSLEIGSFRNIPYAIHTDDSVDGLHSRLSIEAYLQRVILSYLACSVLR